MQDAFAIGATFFLQKPVDRHKLSRLFRSVSGGMLENRRKYTRVPIQTDVTCTVGFPNAPRGILESQSRRNAGGSGWLEAQRCRPSVIPIANLWRDR